MSGVLVANRWPTNAELIADMAQLGYLRKEWLTLDPTFGDGIWWDVWRPDDLRIYNRPKDGSDFRSLPDDNATYDAIAFDPPYCAKGGRKTSGIKDFDAAYGLEDAPKSPKLLQDLIDDGVEEMHRLLKPRGLLLVKCMDYVSSGHLWNGTYLTEKWAVEKMGFTRVDRFVHVGNPGPQPGKRTRKCPACKGKAAGDCAEPGCDAGRIPSVQQHGRQNSSVLFIFQKGR